MTTVGVMEVPRRYYACRACKVSQRPWDLWAGVVGDRHLTEHARKMVTLVGTAMSFDNAAEKLWDLCQIRISNDTVRRVCDEEGERARKWLREAPEPVETLAQAKGDHEFYTDGTSVNTTGGWREMRLSLLARREAGEPCEPGGWDERVLPEPTARLAICAMADCDRVGASWAGLRRRMNLDDAQKLSVIADGAKWIWDQAGKRLPGHNSSWCVDVYHVSQHMHDCGKALMGEGVAARAWADDRLRTALESNGPALIGRLRREYEAMGTKEREPVGKLLGYLGDNADSLWYRDRLKEGRPIGSGQIEGCCKTVIGARLKLNGARWRVQRAERMGALRCLDYSRQTPAYWRNRAA